MDVGRNCDDRQMSNETMTDVGQNCDGRHTKLWWTSNRITMKRNEME
jgi:hypothetical protein